MKLPKTKTENIVVQHISNETLVYDLTAHKAYNLNETSSIVFNACDGKTSFDELKRKHKFTDDLIYLALDELKMNSLLEDYQISHFAGLSRREVIKKVGLASMIALPMISALIAPHPAHAASGSTRTFGQTCDNSAQCASGAPYCSFAPLQGGTGQGSQVCCRSNQAVVGAGYTYNGRYLKGPSNNICQNCSSNYGQDFCCSNTTSYNNTCTVGTDDPRVVDCSYTCQ